QYWAGHSVHYFWRDLCGFVSAARALSGANILRRRDCLHSRLQSSRHHESQHSEVADKRPQRMSEGSRFVAFHQEMAGPGESVGHQRPEQRVPRMPYRKRDNQRAQTQDCSHGMHRAIASIAMLMQIKSEELFVT